MEKFFTNILLTSNNYEQIYTKQRRTIRYRLVCKIIADKLIVFVVKLNHVQP